MTVVSMSWFDAFAYCAFERANGMRFPPRTYTGRVLSFMKVLSAEIRGGLVQEQAGDDQLLDLLGALEDVEDLCVPCPLFEQFRLVVAHRTAELDAPKGNVRARAALDLTRELLEQAGVGIDYDRPAVTQSAAAAKFLQMEADWEAARLMALHAAWMADNREPNSVQASMAKAKAGRSCTEIALGCVELAGSLGYGETELLEKWARDVKILDIFEGTQQIQLLIIARQLLGKSSAELK